MVRGIVRSAVALLALLTITTPASAQNTLLLFLSSGDPGVLPSAPGQATPQPPELGTPLAPVPNLGESARLYIWAAAQSGSSAMSWNAISFNIDIDGPATLSNLTLFNPSNLGQPRWNAGGLFTPPPSAANTEYNNVVMLAGAEYGVRRVPYSDGYAAISGGFPVAGAPVLLGYFDVTYSQITLATVWLEVGGLACGATEGSSSQNRVKLGNAETGLGTLASSSPGTRPALPAAIFNVAPPGTFSLTAPATGRYVTTLSPKLEWTPAQRADTYSVQISANSNMLAPVLTQTGITGTSFTVPAGILDTGVYFWSVSAHNTGGATGAGNGPHDFGVVVSAGETCRADFDRSGSVGVPDIFAFLSAWFVGCP